MREKKNPIWKKIALKCKPNNKSQTTMSGILGKQRQKTIKRRQNYKKVMKQMQTITKKQKKTQQMLGGNTPK